MVIVQITTDNREPFREYHKPVPWFGPAPESLLQGFAKLPDVKVHVISCTQNPMISSPEKIADNIWFHSLHVPKIGWLRGAYIGCVLAIRKKIREIKPDIVHGQGTERECALGAIFSGKPNVLTIHGNMRLIADINRARPFSYQWLAARLEGFTVPRTQGVVCITDYTRRAVSHWKLPTWVVHNAVDERFFDLKPEITKGKMIFFVGNISHRKNQNAFIRAIDPLAKERPIHLVCAGVADLQNDPYSAEFFALMKERPWIEFTGWIGRNELQQWYRRATLVTLPSLEDNCPVAVLEAMAAGVPVLAGNVGGVPELIEDGRTGLLCDPTSLESMRNTMRRLLDDEKLALELARNARVHASQTFHPAAVARRHVEIYRQVLNGPVARKTVNLFSHLS